MRCGLSGKTLSPPPSRAPLKPTFKGGLEGVNPSRVGPFRSLEGSPSREGGGEGGGRGLPRSVCVELRALRTPHLPWLWRRCSVPRRGGFCCALWCVGAARNHEGRLCCSRRHHERMRNFLRRRAAPELWKLRSQRHTKSGRRACPGACGGRGDFHSRLTIGHTPRRNALKRPGTQEGLSKGTHNPQNETAAASPDAERSLSAAAEDLSLSSVH